jgi:hypothetical protein
MSTSSKHAAIQSNLAEIDRLTRDIQNEMVDIIQKTIIEDDIEFTGDLRKSATKGVENGFKTITMDNPYAGFVEWGLLPGTRPNFDALRNWVEHKLGITDEDELNIATIKISNKIFTKGIAPKRFMKKSIRKFISKYGYRQVRTPKTSAGSSGKFLRIVSKINKNLRKINKYVSKGSRIMRGKT